MIKKSFRFEIRAGNGESAGTQISVKAEGPLGDIPYYVNLSYDDTQDEIHLDFIYSGAEKEINTQTSNNYKYNYGMLTGRLYRVVISNASSKASKLYEITKDIKKIRLDVNKSSSRFKFNQNVGKKIMEQTFLKTNNLQSLLSPA